MKVCCWIQSGSIVWVTLNNTELQDSWKWNQTWTNQMVHESSQNSTHFRPYGPRTILWLLSSALRENAFYTELNYTHCDKGHEVGWNGSSDQGAALQRSMQIKVTSKTHQHPPCLITMKCHYSQTSIKNIQNPPYMVDVMSSTCCMLRSERWLQITTETTMSGGERQEKKDSKWMHSMDVG